MVQKRRKVVTRRMLINKIDKLLKGKLSYKEFGDIVCKYETYDYEHGYEDLIDDILIEFIDLHDLGKKNLGFKPYVPSKRKIKEFMSLLSKGSRE